MWSVKSWTICHFREYFACVLFKMPYIARANFVLCILPHCQLLLFFSELSNSHKGFRWTITPEVRWTVLLLFSQTVLYDGSGTLCRDTIAHVVYIIFSNIFTAATFDYWFVLKCECIVFHLSAQPHWNASTAHLLKNIRFQICSCPLLKRPL